MLLLYERLAAIPAGVEPIHCKWTDDAMTVADRIAHEFEATKVFLTGHSKGGAFVNHVAWNLGEFGYIVDGMVLADAWNRVGMIEVPPNVARLWSYRQSHKGGPKGSEIRLADASKTIWEVDERDLPVRHLAVDEYACEKGVIWDLVQAALAGGE
jgi:hypothetical protein